VGNLQQLERLVGSVDSAVRRLRLHYRLLTPKSGFSDGTLNQVQALQHNISRLKADVGVPFTQLEVRTGL
jgi:hypothetical protein